MLVNKIETPLKEYLEEMKVPSLPKVKGGSLFSPDDIAYLARSSSYFIYEFAQEKDEEENDFYELFVKWLHEELHEGYLDVYIIFYLFKDEYLSREQLDYFEQKIPECFEKGRVWFCELNYRFRNRLRIKLIFCKNREFRRFIFKPYLKA